MLPSILIWIGVCLSVGGALCVAAFVLGLCEAAAHGDRMIGQGDSRDG